MGKTIQSFRTRNCCNKCGSRDVTHFSIPNLFQIDSFGRPDRTCDSCWMSDSDTYALASLQDLSVAQILAQKREILQNSCAKMTRTLFRLNYGDFPECHITELPLP